MTQLWKVSHPRTLRTRKEYVVPEGTIIDLITPAQYQELPDGTELISIFGERLIKGFDYIDQDTRGGFLAFGVPTEI